MKLERINAAAQTELPNARPLNRNHRVSKISAPMPDRKRIPDRIAMRIVSFYTGSSVDGHKHLAITGIVCLFGIFATRGCPEDFCQRVASLRGQIRENP